MKKVKDVIVIGGGQSGLAVGYYLRKTHLDFLLLDNQNLPGGAWLHTWMSLKLFSPAEASSLPGWPMPPSKEDYPDRNEVIAYLTAYEKRYQLPIKRPVTVKKVVKTEENLFEIATSQGFYYAKAVVNATGTWQNPYVPGYPGQNIFQGEQIHSAFYQRPEPFKGNRVLIVGGGNSAAQILAEISLYAETTWVTKAPPQFLPDDVDGRYLFLEATKDYQNRQKGVQQTHTVFNLGQIVMVPSVKNARERGVLKHHPPFQKFYEYGVIWPDGSFKEVDKVIWCTGFKPALGHLRALPIFKNGKRVDVKNNESEHIDNLWFVGYGNWTGYASATLIGVGRTAKKVVKTLEDRLT